MPWMFSASFTSLGAIKSPFRIAVINTAWYYSYPEVSFGESSDKSYQFVKLKSSTISEIF